MFEVEDVITIFRNLVRVVEYLHDNDLAHRNLKPDNILLDGTSVNLINFSFSKTLKDTSKKEEFYCGTPNFCSPEIINQKGCIGKKSDVWALGVILFHLLTGKFPFSGKCKKEIFRRILVGQINYPMQISYKAK